MYAQHGKKHQAESAVSGSGLEAFMEISRSRPVPGSQLPVTGKQFHGRYGKEDRSSLNASLNTNPLMSSSVLAKTGWTKFHIAEKI